jgi:hypothetical protein
MRTQDREFITTYTKQGRHVFIIVNPTPNHIRLPNAGLNTFSNLQDYAITDLRPKSIVNTLKMVVGDVQHDKILMVALGMLEKPGQAIKK